MSSLKALDKKIAKKKQVYKPILDNPFTNDANLWPRVNEQQLIWQLLQSNVLSKIKHFSDVSLDKLPWDIIFDFNEIVSYLNNIESPDPAILFVCNKDDEGVPLVVLNQIPLICYLAKVNVTLVQLPRNSYSVIENALPIDKEQCLGLLMIRNNDKLNQQFVSQILKNVAPLKFPWLDNVRYQQSQIKLVKTTMPITTKKKSKKN